MGYAGEVLFPLDHLVLIDGHHLMYRGYWAIPRTLKTSAGEQVNTVFGMASMLLSILKAEQPTHLLLCFDAGEATFRHEENATYKDGRAETPDDFYAQIPRVMELTRAFGFPQVSNVRFEADDFLCTYAKAAEQSGMRVTIVTGDRDAFQLATERTRVAIPHSGYQKPEYLGPAEIEAKYGIRPDQVPAYKGLTGDASDNLPGVKGIGPKTAAELIQAYGSLESIYEHLADIRPSVRSKLEHDREQAFFCQRMAVLVCDIPLPVALEETRLQELPAEPVLQFFTEMEFSMLQRRFREFLRTDTGVRMFSSMEDIVSEVFGAKDANQMTLF